MINFKDDFGLKKLDEDLSKTFFPKKSENKQNNFEHKTKKQKQKDKLLSKRDVETVKYVANFIKQTIIYIKKLVKGKELQIQFDETLKLEEELKKQQLQKAEIERSKLEIKRLSYQEKQFQKHERQMRILRFKLFLERFKR